MIKEPIKQYNRAKLQLQDNQPVQIIRLTDILTGNIE